ncbi:MAG: D-alanyl-D-alanine carboxypeptidase [Clostridia bacterium]|nr:D-alanyl-D-alanine carboxypeptidase [Clostridia bacterium]
MKRITILLCVFALAVSMFGISAAADAPVKPEIGSEAALVIDADTGATLFQKNEKSQLPPADPAQIMTVLLALESGKADQTVTVTKDITATFDPKGTNLPLVEGEEVKIRDLLYAIMLGSYSDAAKTVAAAISGSETAFAEKMTARIQAITGTQSSTFANADGEPAAGNRTTARDLALLVKEAMKNDEFRQIFTAVTYTMGATNKNASERSFTTICLLMKNSDMNVKYEGAVGGKSGWNKDAKYTMVSIAERDGRTLICVVLGAENSKQRYTETIALFDYSFGAYRNVDVPTSLLQPTEIPVIKDGQTVRKILVSIPEGTKLSTNVEYKEGTMTVSSLPTSVMEGATNITLTVSAKDDNNITVVLGSVILDVTTKEDQPPVSTDTGSLGSQTVVPQSFGSKLWGFVKTVLLIILYIILAIVLLAVALVAVSYIQRTQRRNRKRRRAEERKREEEEEEEEQQPAYTGRRHRGIAAPETKKTDDDDNDEDDEDEF